MVDMHSGDHLGVGHMDLYFIGLVLIAIVSVSPTCILFPVPILISLFLSPRPLIGILIVQTWIPRLIAHKMRSHSIYLCVGGPITCFVYISICISLASGFKYFFRFLLSTTFGWCNTNHLNFSSVPRRICLSHSAKHSTGLLISMVHEGTLCNIVGHKLVPASNNP